ncbi:MAG: PEGA domain-containing protein [Fibrobacterota bacterium]
MLIVRSSPDSAEISVNDVRTGAFTPDTLNLDEGTSYVTVLMKGVHFRSRKVELGRSDTATLSFSSIPVFDTLSITGTEYYGIINLPEPPVDIPYLVNGKIVPADTALILPEGTYDIHWDGGIGYYPVDTTMQIFAGEKHRPAVVFDKRFGRIDLRTSPKNAQIYLDDTLFGVGRTIRPVIAGTHDLRVVAEGYTEYTSRMVVLPGQYLRDTLNLQPSPDRDGDGFDDTVDLCPDLYGVYEGCPKNDKGREMRKVWRYLGRHMWDNPLSIEVAAASAQKKTAYNDSLRQFLDLYNDGSALMNNYAGVSLFDRLWIGWRSFILTAAYGQSIRELRYEKNYTLPFLFDENDSLSYDAFDQRRPRARIRSASFGGGVRLCGDVVSLALMAQYVQEILVFSGLLSRDSTRVQHSYDNSHAGALIRVNAAPFERGNLRPEIYASLFFSEMEPARTGWTTMRAGILIPWRFERTVGK